MALNMMLGRPEARSVVNLAMGSSAHAHTHMRTHIGRLGTFVGVSNGLLDEQRTSLTATVTGFSPHQIPDMQACEDAASLSASPPGHAGWIYLDGTTLVCMSAEWNVNAMQSMRCDVIFSLVCLLCLSYFLLTGVSEAHRMNAV
jgi:hypothetical protein